MQTTNMLIANQSVADLAVSMLIMIPMRIGKNVKRESPWDQFVCRMWSSGYFLYVALFDSTYNILALTAERYVAVIYPVMHKVCFEICKRYRVQ
jgi:7 transmembrane receptor (rhodopsin family)